MIYYTRITGTLLWLVFGSLDGLLAVRALELGNLREHLLEDGTATFARITDLQVKDSRNGAHYFLSLAGRLDSLRFEAVDEVPQEIFHVHNRGSNIEVLVYTVANRKPIVHIRNNPIPYGNDLENVRLVSRILNLLGASLALFGFGLGPLLKHVLPDGWLGETHRPDLRKTGAARLDSEPKKVK